EIEVAHAVLVLRLIDNLDTGLDAEPAQLFDIGADNAPVGRVVAQKLDREWPSVAIDHAAALAGIAGLPQQFVRPRQMGAILARVARIDRQLEGLVEDRVRDTPAIFLENL